MYETDEGCLSENELGAFAEGNVEPKDRPRMEAHLAECAKCREVVVFVFRFINESPSSEREIQ